mgnify:CR=1 FL=1
MYLQRKMWIWTDFFEEFKAYTAGLHGREPEDMYIQTAMDEMNSVDSVMGGLSAAVGGIAAISLLVGGIGIMNIMLVSVTERTRENRHPKGLGSKDKGCADPVSDRIGHPVCLRRNCRSDPGNGRCGVGRSGSGLKNSDKAFRDPYCGYIFSGCWNFLWIVSGFKGCKGRSD